MENRPPNVLVSSTMYDLSELRPQIRDLIEGLGWRAVMSEHNSFVNDTSETTVEDSPRNIRENTDIFVMIVGARYGSSDLEPDQRVTNFEFNETRACGAPACVFVDGEVLEQLEIWRRNPEADFAGIVDTPKIFEFIDSFQGSSEVWTFPFSTADDIIDTLHQHFAHLVQDSLGLRQMAQNKDRLLAALEGHALQIALRRDEYWEYRLFGAVLADELTRRTTLRREIEHRLTRADVTYVDLGDLADWVFDRFHEFDGLGHSAKSILDNYLPQALGDQGVPGNPVEIAACARRLVQVWEDSARWTLRCRSIRVDPRAEHLIDLLSATNTNMLEEIWQFGHEFSTRFNNALKASTDDEPIVIKMNLTLSADLDDFYEEFDRFMKSVEP